MARFRRDTKEVNEFGQTLHYAIWMGGPTLSAIGGCRCADKPRMVEISGQPDTFFSIPAKVKVKGKTVSGFVMVMEGCWSFYATGKNKRLLAINNF